MEKNFWRIQALVLAFCLTLLGVGVTVYNVYGGEKTSLLQSGMENNYNLAYYNLYMGMEKMNNGLDVMEVSSSRTYQAEILDEITSGAELAGGGLAALSFKDGELSEIQNEINQTGDYARFLMKKLVSGGDISDAEKENLVKLNDNIKAYVAELTTIGELVESGEYSFFSDVSSSDGRLATSYKNVSGENMEYPEIVYEGLFSDGVETPEPKGLSTTETSIENLQSRVPFYIDGDVKCVKEKASSKTGSLQTIIFETETYEGETGTIQLTKMGGELVGFSMGGNDKGGKTDRESCLVAAQSYLRTRGFDGMELFRTQENENSYTFSLCKVENGVYLLPQSVSVTVLKSDAKINAVNCLSYLLSRENLSVDVTDVIGASEAKSAVSQNLSDLSSKLCLAKINGVNKLCYEVEGKYKGQTYYIYLDAKTGREVFIEKA